ncbi:MAG: sialate O-acetylesterase [Puniceicoccales bacterium]
MALEEDAVYTATLHADFPYQPTTSTVVGIAFTTANEFNVGTALTGTTRGYLELRRTGDWSFYDVGSKPELAGGAVGELFSTPQTDYEIELVLTTSSTEPWTLAGYLGGVQVDLAPADPQTMSFVYPANPHITGVGITSTSSAYTLKNFEFQGPVVGRPVASTSRVIDVFLLAGQSNMSGRVDTGFAPDPRDAECLYYYRTDGPATSDVDSGGQFQELSTLASGYYGPEITMARNLVDKGYRVAVIKVSDGGRSLDVDWNSTTYGIWWKNWLSEVNFALSELERMGYIVRLRGFLWLQGETDASNAGRAANYEDNFIDLLANVNAQLTAWGYDVSTMERVCALIRTQSGAHAETVRDAQITVMDASADACWFDTDDLSMQPDNLHYDAAGIQAIGVRFAEPFPKIEEFSDWTGGHGLNGNDALPGADADGNGLDNLTEYALGIIPGSMSEQPVYGFSGIDLALTHPVLRQDVAYQAEWSDDLLQWHNDQFIVDRAADTATAHISMSGRSQLFLRLLLVLE